MAMFDYQGKEIGEGDNPLYMNFRALRVLTKQVWYAGIPIKFSNSSN